MKSGGERGIRTLGTRKGTTVFETAPFDHSGTSPRGDPGNEVVVEQNQEAALPMAARAWASPALFIDSAHKLRITPAPARTAPALRAGFIETTLP